MARPEQICVRLLGYSEMKHIQERISVGHPKSLSPSYRTLINKLLAFSFPSKHTDTSELSAEVSP